MSQHILSLLLLLASHILAVTELLVDASVAGDHFFSEPLNEDLGLLLALVQHGCKCHLELVHLAFP